ncbi:hypothetical protein [Bacillus cereus]|uniref:hypothetical protein n=1 Tax=Bacillus cereus TaxID=1396 RepID=UPI001C8C7FE9|nr:hypothetical protein [Bacillus cereus]MBX9158271.1 hypothetical protein [Bacillus cereus]
MGKYNKIWIEDNKSVRGLEESADSLLTLDMIDELKKHHKTLDTCDMVRKITVDGVSTYQFRLYEFKKTFVITVELGKKGWSVFAGLENEKNFWSVPCPSPDFRMVRVGLMLMFIGLSGEGKHKKEVDKEVHKDMGKTKGKKAKLH